jgi:hypothetical protein
MLPCFDEKIMNRIGIELLVRFTVRTFANGIGPHPSYVLGYEPELR